MREEAKCRTCGRGIYMDGGMHGSGYWMHCPPFADGVNGYYCYDWMWQNAKGRTNAAPVSTAAPTNAEIKVVRANPNRKDIPVPTTEQGMTNVQGYHIEVVLDTGQFEDNDEFFNTLPKAEDIAKALAPLFPPFCKLLVRDDGFSDYDIEGGKA